MNSSLCSRSLFLQGLNNTQVRKIDLCKKSWVCVILGHLSRIGQKCMNQCRRQWLKVPRYVTSRFMQFSACCVQKQVVCQKISKRNTRFMLVPNFGFVFVNLPSFLCPTFCEVFVDVTLKALKSIPPVTLQKMAGAYCTLTHFIYHTRSSYQWKYAWSI